MFQINRWFIILLLSIHGAIEMRTRESFVLSLSHLISFYFTTADSHFTIAYLQGEVSIEVVHSVYRIPLDSQKRVTPKQGTHIFLVNVVSPLFTSAEKP